MFVFLKTCFTQFQFYLTYLRCCCLVTGRSTKAAIRGNIEATGVPTSVPVRVAHELLQAGHKYLDVRCVARFLGQLCVVLSSTA